MKDYDINKMKNSVYTSLVLLFTISSLFKTSYPTPITVDFGGYDSYTDITLIIEPDNDQRIEFSSIYKKNLYSRNNYSSCLLNANIPRLLNLKLNKYIFPQNISVKYQDPIFIKSRLKNKIISNLQVYQNDPLPHIS